MWKIDTNTNSSIITCTHIYIYAHICIYIDIYGEKMFPVVGLFHETRARGNGEENKIETHCICVGTRHNERH
jgi:hypothetical protein